MMEGLQNIFSTSYGVILSTKVLFVLVAIAAGTRARQLFKSKQVESRDLKQVKFAKTIITESAIGVVVLVVFLELLGRLLEVAREVVGDAEAPVPRVLRRVEHVHLLVVGDGFLEQHVLGLEVQVRRAALVGVREARQQLGKAQRLFCCSDLRMAHADGAYR